MNFYIKNGSIFIKNADGKFEGVSLEAVTETVSTTKVVGLTPTVATQEIDKLENAKIMTSDEVIRAYGIDANTDYDFPVLITPIDDIVFSAATKDVTVVTDPTSATITATSSDELVAIVSVLGKVITITKVDEGETIITITASKAGYADGIFSFKATIIPAVEITPINAVTLDKATDTVTVVTDPIDAVVSAVSDDELVVTVAVDDHTLTLTRVGNGSAEITVTASADDYDDGVATFDVTASGAEE